MQLKSAAVEGMSVRWLDIPMRWVEQGNGLPLVLVHGTATGPLLWREVVPRIIGARCLAWEMVGYGASIPEGRERDLSVSCQADYLILWLKHLGIERAVLAGHDVGGGVAQIAAVRYPGICAGLFLTNAIGRDFSPVPGVKGRRMLDRVVRHLPDPLFKALFLTFLRHGHDSREQARIALEVHWPHYARYGAAEAFARQVNALDARDMSTIVDRLSSLGVPARVVWGAADDWRKIIHGESLARNLHAPLRRIVGAKHFTPEDHPDIVAEEINILLQEVRNARPRMVHPS